MRLAPRRLVWVAIIALLLFAAGLRWHQLGVQSFWNDEGNSYVQATRDLSAIADHAARDIHPPVYYWLLALWRGLAGESEFALRALSVFASLISVALAFAIGKRLFAPGAGLVAALLVALNNFSVYYAQEARMYALLALWGAAAIWLLILLMERPTAKRALALGLINAAGLWTQYSFPLLMLAQGAIALMWLAGAFRSGERRLLRDQFVAFVGANLLAIVLFAPWLPTAWGQVTGWPNTGQSVPFAQALGTIIAWLMFGVSSAGALLSIGELLLLFGLLNPTRGGARPPLALARMLTPVLWVVVPVGLFLAAGLYRPANLKFLLPAQIGFALWMARGLWVLWSLTVRRSSPALLAWVPRLAAALALIWLTLNLWQSLLPIYSDPAYQRADYRAIAADIRADLRPGDAIILNAPNQEEVFRYYFTDYAPIYPLPPGLGGDDAETLAAVRAIIDQHERAFVVFWGETERDPRRVVETALDAQAFEAGETWYGDVRLARYVMPAPLTLEVESGARFGDAMMLERYALNARALRPGDALQLRLDWRADAPLDTRYKVFVQLLDADGVLAAQRDSEPGGGLALTTTWTPGEAVVDNHALIIPPSLEPGDYTLIVGLYPLDDPAARLPVEGADFLTLTTITIE